MHCRMMCSQRRCRIALRVLAMVRWRQMVWRRRVVHHRQTMPMRRHYIRDVAWRRARHQHPQRARRTWRSASAATRTCRRTAATTPCRPTAQKVTQYKINTSVIAFAQRRHAGRHCAWISQRSSAQLRRQQRASVSVMCMLDTGKALLADGSDGSSEQRKVRPHFAARKPERTNVERRQEPSHTVRDEGM